MLILLSWLSSLGEEGTIYIVEETPLEKPPIFEPAALKKVLNVYCGSYSTKHIPACSADLNNLPQGQVLLACTPCMTVACLFMLVLSGEPLLLGVGGAEGTPLEGTPIPCRTCPLLALKGHWSCQRSGSPARPALLLLVERSFPHFHGRVVWFLYIGIWCCSRWFSSWGMFLKSFLLCTEVPGEEKGLTKHSCLRSLRSDRWLVWMLAVKWKWCGLTIPRLSFCLR